MLSYAAAAAGLLALTACSGNNTVAATATPAPPAASAPSSGSASTDSAPSTAGGGPASVAYTRQGAKLHLGQKADVPFKSENVSGTVGIAVTKIDKGDPADLAPLQLGDKANGLTPYYVRFTVTDDSGSNFANTMVTSVHGMLPDGSDAQDVALFSSFDKCDNANAGENFTTVGASYQTCELVLAPGTTPVTSAAYDESEYTALAPNTDYGTAPITWQP
jgi:hypothetical protein